MRFGTAAFALAFTITALPTAALACMPPPVCSPSGTLCLDWYYRDGATVYRADDHGRRDLWTIDGPLVDPRVSDRGDVVEVDVHPDNGSAAALTFFVNGVETGKLALGELLADIEAADYKPAMGYRWVEHLEWNDSHRLVVTTVEGVVIEIDPRNPVLPAAAPVAEEPALGAAAEVQWECGTALAHVEMERRGAERLGQVRFAAAVGLPLGAMLGLLILGRIRRRRTGDRGPRASRTTVH